MLASFWKYIDISCIFQFFGGDVYYIVDSIVAEVYVERFFSKHAGYVEIGFSENTITKKSIYQEIWKNASMVQPGDL